MRSALRAVITSAMLTAALLLSSSPAAASDDGMTVRSDESARIDGWVEDRMAVHGTPGAAVVVVRGGEVVHLAGYGVADPQGSPVTPQTPFVIGSASKPFTALVVRQLVAEDKLSLQEPVLPYLGHLVDQAPAGFEDVTVGQLLNHTGGLSMGVGLAGTVKVRNGGDALNRRVADLLAEPLSSDPGEQWEYSNAGAMLLAAVVEQVTGEKFAEQLRTRVFDPLHMDASFATEDDPRAEHLATGHRSWLGRWRPSDLPYDNAGVAMGYIGSSASDLAGFLLAHLGHHDDQVSIPATAAQIASEHVEATGWDIPLEGGYGRGWFVDNFAGEKVVSHSGSLGHFTSHLVMVRGADDLGVAVLSNASAFVAAGHEGQYDLSLGLTRMLLNQSPEPSDPRPLMSVVVPVLTWILPLLILGVAARFVLVTRQRFRSTRDKLNARTIARHVVLPALAYAAIGAALLTTAPLAQARHFYPDVGWGLTVTAYLALTWSAARTVLASHSLRAERTEPSR